MLFLVAARVCVKCDVRNTQECLANRKLVEWKAKKICATTARKNGLITVVIKHRKQKDACFNEQKTA